MSRFSRKIEAVFNKLLLFINRLLYCLFVSSGFNLKQDNVLHAPIFIIGAPRSGSTLLYQVLTSYWDIAYLSNLHCKFYSIPSLIERVFRPSRKYKPQSYTSFYGQAPGCFSPGECGEFWYQFFRRCPPYVTLEDVDERKMFIMQSTIRKLSCIAKKPILFKNLYCSLRLEPIKKYLPESVFIVITRDVIDNAHSILEGRKKKLGEYDKWWSVEPPEAEELKSLPAHEQVAEQIYCIYNLISRNANEIGEQDFLWISYEDLCSDVKGTLRQISMFLSQKHIRLNQRTDSSELPDSFRMRDDIRIDQKLYDELITYIKAR